MRTQANITKRTRRVRWLQNEVLKALDKISKEYPVWMLKRTNLLDVIAFMPDRMYVRPNEFGTAIEGLERDDRIVVLRGGLFDRVFKREWVV